MAILRVLSEGVLRLLYRAASIAFWAQGVAFGAAAYLALSSQEPAPWVVAARPSVLWLGATFVAGGIALFVITFRPRAALADHTEEQAVSPVARPAIRGVSLLALSVAALVASRELHSLWSEIVVLLERAGLFHELPGGGAGSGLVLAPLMVVLYAPLLSASAATALIVLPVLLAAALAARIPRFTASFVGAMVCCAVLVGAALFAGDLLERMVSLAGPTLRSDRDPIGAHVAAELERGAGVILRAGRAQGMVLLCHLAWLPFLLMGTRGGAATDLEGRR